jgi:O-antigen/teichoic acid export membrane protein
VGVAFLFLLFRADILILNAMVRSSQVGLYSLAVTVAELTYMSADVIAQVMLPHQTDSSMEASGELTVRLVRANALVAILSSTLIIVTSEFLLLTVFGDKYSGVLAPLVVLMPGIVALAAVRSAYGFLIRLDRPLITSITAGGAMVLNVGLNVLLIPELGIVGSALASSVAYAALASCWVIWVSRATCTPLRAFIPTFADVLSAVGHLGKERDARR